MVDTIEKKKGQKRNLEELFQCFLPHRAYKILIHFGLSTSSVVSDPLLPMLSILQDLLQVLMIEESLQANDWLRFFLLLRVHLRIRLHPIICCWKGSVFFLFFVPQASLMAFCEKAHHIPSAKSFSLTHSVSWFRISAGSGVQSSISNIWVC